MPGNDAGASPHVGCSGSPARIRVDARVPNADDPRVLDVFRTLFSARFWPILLIVYICVLATATHWPQLKIDGPVPRSDLYIHILAFGTLGGLVTLSAFFGPPPSRRNAVCSWLAAMAYAAIDETTQAIPGLGRTAALDDFLANTVGITLGVVAAVLVIKLVLPTGHTPSTPTNRPQTSTDS